MPHHYIAVVAANFSTQRLQGDNVHQTIVGRSFVCFAVDTNFLEIVSLLCWAVLCCAVVYRCETMASAAALSN